MTRILPTLIFVCLLAAVTCAADGNGEREDLHPRQVRWQVLPVDVARVSFDASGRAWCEVRQSATLVELKAQTVRACALKAPWISGARIVLHDRSGRVWLHPEADRKLLLGFEPRSGTWLERRTESEGSQHVPCFTAAAHESRDGRLYFSDRLGVHVLAGGKWSYQRKPPISGHWLT